MPTSLKTAATFLGIVLLATLVTLGLRTIPFLSTIETWAMDLRVATVLPREPQHPDIVFVAIGEDTLSLFPYRSPVDRAFVANLVRTLEAKGAKAIFLDMLFDQATEEEKDAALRSALHAAKIPLVISYGDQREGLTDDQVEFMEAFLPPGAKAFANLQKDPYDGVARWIYPGRADRSGAMVQGIAPAMVTRLGNPAPQWAGDLFIAYRGQPDAETPSFRQFPAQAVPVLPAAWFQDKIVVVGADLLDRDRHPTPFKATDVSLTGSGYMAGALIHAHAIAQLLEDRKPPDRSFATAALAVFLAAMLGGLLGRWEIPLWGRALIGIAAALGLWVGAWVLFNQTTAMLPVVMPTLAFALSIWLMDIYAHRQERDQRKFIQGAFSKYLSPALLDELVKDPAKLSLDPKRREMSFIFTDVAGFTTISESMDAVQLADVMNRYLDGVVKVVFAHGGTVDKFIGDAVFAIFNAPKDQADHAEKAIRCALAIDRFAQDFLAAEVAAGSSFGMTRIGVHTGTASIGNFGAQERFEYTALGDAVNTAARLEGMNKYFGTRVAMSGATAERAVDLPRRPIGRIVLKGKTEPIQVYQPLAPDEAAAPFFQDYLAAYGRMCNRDPDALDAFRRLAAVRPDDGPTKLHLKRLEAGETTEVVVMTDK